MEGKILNITGKFVLIRASNTDKFEVPLSEIKSDLSPRVGDDIDFDLIEGKVKSVYVLRQTASVNDHLSFVKSSANHIHQKVKSNINEENLERAKDLAFKAKGKAKESLGSLNLPALKSKSGISVHNKFALFTLTCLFASMLLPAVSLGLGGSVSYFELVDNVTMQIVFILASSVSLAIGAPRFISKALCIICLITIFVPLYELFSSLSELVDVGREFGVTNNGFLKQLVKVTEIGLPMLIISFLLFLLTTLLPRYKTSPLFFSILKE